MKTKILGKLPGILVTLAIFCGAVGIALPLGVSHAQGNDNSPVSLTINEAITVSDSVVLSTPPPSIAAIVPASGPTAGGTGVTITGSGFLSGATVTFGGTAATGVIVVDSTHITAMTPAHAAGAVNVVVANPDTQYATLPGGFTYIPEVLANLLPRQYRWSLVHTPKYQWDPYPTLFKAWNQVRFENKGPGNAFNVQATITWAPPNVTILDAVVSFGDIPAGGSAWSTDDYALATDMSTPSDPKLGIKWKIEYDDALGGHHIIENVPQ